MQQFLKYVGSGGIAAMLALAAYALMVKLGVWYIAASVISDGIGLLLIFLLNKYVVFQKHGQIGKHAVRYAIVQVLNTIFQAAAIYVMVEYMGADKVLARVIAIGLCVPVNFFLYKHVVYK